MERSMYVEGTDRTQCRNSESDDTHFSFFFCFKARYLWCISLSFSFNRRKKNSLETEVNFNLFEWFTPRVAVVTKEDLYSYQHLMHNLFFTEVHHPLCRSIVYYIEPKTAICCMLSSKLMLPVLAIFRRLREHGVSNCWKTNSIGSKEPKNLNNAE